MFFLHRSYEHKHTASMHYRTLLLCCLLLGTYLPLHAQKPAKRAKVRTERRANERLDQKVDQGVDKAFSAIEGLFGKKKKSPATDSTAAANATEDGLTEDAAASSLLSALTGDQGDWEPYTNPTPFSLVMNVKEVKKNGKEEESRMRLGATSDRFAVIIQGEGKERSQMILNTEDGKTTMVTTDKKGETAGFRMRMPSMGKMAKDIATDMQDYMTMTRTGERKTIDGYDCEKILVEDSKHHTTTESWVTQDIALNYRDIFGGMAGMAGAGKQVSAPSGPAPLFDGFPILSITDDGKRLSEMHITDIRVGERIDRALFDTSGVEIQELGFN